MREARERKKERKREKERIEHKGRETDAEKMEVHHRATEFTEQAQRLF